MRTVYYVIGPSASGKTTISKKLSKSMNLNIYHADNVYAYLHEKYDIKVPRPRLLLYRQWDDPKNFGIDSWGDYEDMHQAKKPMYKKLLQEEEFDFIIEGFSLSFKSERELVKAAVGPHRAILLRLDLPYENWAEFSLKKKGQLGNNAQKNYERLRECFERGEADTVYTFDDPDKINVHYGNYQRPGFTDKKIAALNVPVQENDVVNDIGCNAGEIGAWCLEKGAQQVHGYETNWRFLDDAFQKGLVPHLMDVERHELQPADITICASVFHYFENPQAFLRKVRRSTRRLFVLELPVHESGGKIASYHENKNGIRRAWYSQNLLSMWLNDNFSDVQCIGESVSPDRSKRFVYHCYV